MSFRTRPKGAEPGWAPRVGMYPRVYDAKRTQAVDVEWKTRHAVASECLSTLEPWEGSALRCLRNAGILEAFEPQSELAPEGTAWTDDLS